MKIENGFVEEKHLFMRKKMIKQTKVIHIIGTMLAGKSTVIKRIKEEVETSAFDVWDIDKSFYRPLKIINTEDKFNWDKFHEYKDHIGFALELALRQSPYWFLLLESSGTNKAINFKLHQLKTEGLIEITPVILECPSDKELKKRARIRGIDIKSALEFRDIYDEKILSILSGLDSPPKEMTVEEAVNFIKGQLHE